jgi:hypothetical protein
MIMIEMNDLEQAWNGLDERLERHDVLLNELRRRDVVDGVRARLRLVSTRQFVQLAIGILIVLWAGGYWYDHLGQTHLVVYGVALHLYGLGLLVSAALQLTRLAQLDYRAPVLEVQSRLVALRRLRFVSERALLIAGFVAWVPLLFIAMHAAGFDLWLTDPATVWWNLAGGIVMALFVAWLSHRFRTGFERDAAGRSLRDAEAELAELVQEVHN